MSGMGGGLPSLICQLPLFWSGEQYQATLNSLILSKTVLILAKALCIKFDMRPQWGAIHRKAGLRIRGRLFSLSSRNKNRHTKSLITTGLTEAQAIGRRIGILSPEFSCLALQLLQNHFLPQRSPDVFTILLLALLTQGMIRHKIRVHLHPEPLLT